MAFQSAVIVGSTGGLGSAITRRLLSLNPNLRLAALSRSGVADFGNDGRVIAVKCDISNEDSVAKAAEQVKSEFGGADLVWNCTGVLHNEATGLKPEKSLRNVSQANLLEQFTVNAFGVAYLGKHFLPILKNGERVPSVFASISAKVGSIEDNKLGGWVSYRAAKSAQNQMLQCMHLEYTRKTNIQVVALQPGTVATNLSAPFRVAGGEGVFAPDDAAQNLVDVVTNVEKGDRAKFLDYAGKTIPW